MSRGPGEIQWFILHVVRPGNVWAISSLGEEYARRYGRPRGESLRVSFNRAAHRLVATSGLAGYWYIPMPTLLDRNGAPTGVQEITCVAHRDVATAAPEQIGKARDRYWRQLIERTTDEDLQAAAIDVWQRHMRFREIAERRPDSAP